MRVCNLSERGLTGPSEEEGKQEKSLGFSLLSYWAGLHLNIKKTVI